MRRPGASHLVASTLAALLLATSCGGGDDDDASGADRDQAASADSTTSTSADDPSSSSTAPIPEAGDWEAVLMDIKTRIADLMADPDPPDRERLAEVVQEDCECFDVLLTDMEELAESDRHLEEEGRSVLFVNEETTSGSGGARLTVRWNVPTTRLIDSDGEVVDEEPGGPHPVCTTTVVGPDGLGGAWLLYSETDLQGCPPEAE
jgi:hypothetical protein